MRLKCEVCQKNRLLFDSTSFGSFLLLPLAESGVLKSFRSQLSSSLKVSAQEAAPLINSKGLWKTLFLLVVSLSFANRRTFAFKSSFSSFPTKGLPSLRLHWSGKGERPEKKGKRVFGKERRRTRTFYERKEKKQNRMNWRQKWKKERGKAQAKAKGIGKKPTPKDWERFDSKTQKFQSNRCVSFCCLNLDSFAARIDGEWILENCADTRGR